VTASIQKQDFRERFQVEEFRKVSCELDLTGSKRHDLLGRASTPSTSRPATSSARRSRAPA